MFRFLILSAGALLSSGTASAETMAGSATVVDGDSLALEGRSIRLFGIDAPETDQTCQRDGEVWSCGLESTSQLAALVEGQIITCQITGIDGYGRSIAVCMAGYFEINETIVEQCWATAFRKYSSDYVAAETRARSARAGLWSSQFELPEHHRLAKRNAAASSVTEGNRSEQSRSPSGHDGSCTIKGNRNRRGQLIYHLPGMPYYDVTRPEEIFCSEAAAREAGYRRSIVR
ncbi:MAG: thermonuclease family protein [Pontixanthobacter sp.]